MKPEQTGLNDLAAELRLSFDQSFATVPADTHQVTERFLALVIGGDYYALRLSEVSGLFADREVVPLPSRSPDLLGIASFRGAIVPVYDLRLMLGYPAGPKPRWLVLIAPDTPVGLAFDQLEGYLDSAPEAIAPEAGTEHKRPHISESLRADGLVRSIVGTASLLETVQQRGR